MDSILDGTKQTIVLDCDDVLINLRVSLFKAIEKEYGVDISNTPSYDLHNMLGINIKQFFECLLKHKAVETSFLDLGVMQSIDYMKQHYNLVMVSARGWHPKAEELTRETLNSCDIELDDYIFLKPGQEKFKVIHERLGKCYLIIDDHYNHCYQALLSGAVTKAIIPRRPWNSIQEIVHASKYPDKISFVDTMYEVSSDHPFLVSNQGVAC